MSDGIECENCKNHTYETRYRTDMDGEHPYRVIVCDFGHRIGPGGSPVDDCKYEPIESEDDDSEDNGE